MRSDVPQEKYVGRAALQARLLRLYPRAWRERYGDEVLALIEQSGGGCGASRLFTRRRGRLCSLSNNTTLQPMPSYDECRPWV